MWCRPLKETRGCQGRHAYGPRRRAPALHCERACDGALSRRGETAVRSAPLSSDLSHPVLRQTFMSLLSARELTKRYPGVLALDALTLDVEPGVIGFVGA